mgnify:CR=1 FL=1
MKIKTIAALLSCWVVLLCLPGCGRKPHAGRYKIALVHSYEAGYPDAGRTREMLSDALAGRGISCDFREYFLDCDDLLSAKEEERCSDFIDDFTRWGARLVAVLDDQALYSLMACGNPRLHDLPVVFGGVNYPNRKLLERYPYAIGVKTGYTDDAGLCLVTAAEKDGTRLIIVTLNGKDDVNTHMRLYEHFFPLLARVDLSGFTEGLSVPVTGGTRDSVAAVPAAEPEAALLERHQLYPMNRLVRDVEKAWECGIFSVNLVPEPVTTFELVDVIKSAMPASALREKQHPAKRSFQAIRIAVNDELGAVDRMVREAVPRLNPGGRLAVISFHSLEDRIVKNALAAFAKGCTCPPDFPVCVCGKKPQVKLVNKKPIVSGAAELEENPRARSAKLRVAEKL